MTDTKRNLRRENGRDSAASLAAAESPDAARRVVTSVIRRQAHLLNCVHEVVMADLIRRGLEADAEEFNDRVKPVIDELFAFELRGSDVQA